MNNKLKFALLPVAALVLAGCTASPSATDFDKATADMLKNSFQERGIAKLDRLVQDDANRECVAADVSGKPLDDKVAKAIEAANMKTIKWPAGGKFLGDWKEGDGLTWTDQAGAANGGNCYNCHQISKEEISFGTLGPSLYNYGKLRGVTPLQLRQAARRHRPECRRQQGHRGIHLGQALQRAGLQRVFANAARRPQGHPDRAADAARDGTAAGPGFAGEQVIR